MDIKSMSEIEIKALKCDHWENIQTSERVINILNQELKRRQDEAANPVLVKPPEELNG